MRYERIVQPYHNGGLGLVDVRLKNISLKANWVKRIRETSSSWKTFTYNSLPMKHHMIWLLNICPTDIRKNFPKTFWRDVWQAWSHINYHVPHTRKDVERQIMWYNSHITGHFIYNRTLMNAGVLFVRDFIAETDNRWKTVHEFNFDNATQIDFLTYNGIVKCIPNEWLRIARLSENSTNTGGYKLIANVKGKTWSSYVYKHLLDKQYKNDNLVRFQWETELKIEISDKKWSNVV